MSIVGYDLVNYWLRVQNEGKFESLVDRTSILENCVPIMRRLNCCISTLCFLVKVCFLEDRYLWLDFDEK